MSEYVVEAKSRLDLRKLAYAFRRKLGLTDSIYFPVVDILDVMCEIFKKFTYDVVEDTFFPCGIHADTDIKKEQIRIRESVYNGACDGNGRDRMTIAHEIGHYLTLCFCDFTLKRNFEEKEVPVYCSPEWQAKCFAGELLIPKHLTSSMSIADIEENCGVSHAAASYQYDVMHRR